VEQETAAVVMNWHQALNAGEIERLIALSHPQIELIGPRGSAFGYAALEQWFMAAGLTLEVVRLYGRQDVVVAVEQGLWRSAETGEVVGQKEVATVFRVQGSQIVSLARYDTLEAALGQAGLMGEDLVSM
jgi:hypothetical protein